MSARGHARAGDVEPTALIRRVREKSQEMSVRWRFMQLSIKGHDLDLSDALRAYTERRLRFSLGGFATRLRSVDVRLSDVNGPRGGIDKDCAITIILRQLGVVFARAKGVDAYSTVDCAASRARSALARRLNRHRAGRRRGHRPSNTRSERRADADK